MNRSSSSVLPHDAGDPQDDPAILGVILELPPVKKAMAGRQMKSRYLEY